jgi:hypothetical protein
MAAIIGGVIGMFVSPGMFPLGLLDVLLTGILPALFVALIVNTDNNIDWLLSIIAIIITGIFFLVFPYVWPTIPGEIPDIGYFLSTLVFWVPWLIIIFTPLRKMIPEWARSDDRKMKYIGTVISVLIGMELFYYWWGAPYWYIFTYPVALAFAANLGYSIYWPFLAIVTGIIAIPIIEALQRSGLPRIPRATW